MLNAIYATTAQGGMGYHNKLPWPRHNEDMKWFKSHTSGCPVIMGRKTWEAEDMITPLPNRDNWVITSDPIRFMLNNPNTEVSAATDPLEVYNHLIAKNPNVPVWVIGGAQLIQSLSDNFDKIYLTIFSNDFVYNESDFVPVDRYINHIFLKKYKLAQTIEGADAEWRIYEKLP